MTTRMGTRGGFLVLEPGSGKPNSRIRMRVGLDRDSRGPVRMSQCFVITLLSLESDKDGGNT